MGALLAFLLLASRPAAAQVEPTTSVRVEVSTAQILGLDCSRRPFAWENTKATGRWYRYIAGQAVTEGLDPRPMLMSVVSAVILTPVYIASMPADLLAAPFRKDCSFTLKLEGKLAEWAGMSAGALPLEAEAVTLLSAEVPGVKKAEYAVFKSSTTSAADGRYSIAIPAAFSRVQTLAVKWRVKGMPGGQLQLDKKGRRFILSEPDPGFGVGGSEMEPLVIEPSENK
ncbi:MAG: hypothetical protein HYZ75_03245 [Elusimicrobia bacterium]|nr:hypothetical protein [Elusimicrobiota bacterium]